MIEVRGYRHEQAFADYKRRVKDGPGFFVHEHLVRERSSCLAGDIDEQKTGSEEKVVIYMRAENRYVSFWIDWLYGQPMFPQWEDEIHDGVLEDFVQMFRLAYFNDDYECANLCLDAIRGLFLEGSAELEEPLDKLKPLLYVLNGYDDEETVLDMISHVVAYGPGADPGQSKLWLTTLADHYPLDDWARLWRQLGLAFATKVAAQASGDLGSVPDIMAEHAYHLCKPEEELCCGRTAPPESGFRKRLVKESARKKRRIAESEEEDDV